MRPADLLSAAMTLAVIGVLAGAAAAFFSLLAWLTGRQRQSFTLRRDGHLVRLTRARRPAVQLRRAFVFHRGDLITADLAATTEWRVLRRDQRLILDLRQETPDGEDVQVPFSESLSVQYRRLWPWSREAPGSLNRVLLRRVDRDSKNKRQERRDAIDGEYFMPGRPWREWSAPML